jgi:ABC-type multidrug transport system fused ATPase/permease subunit
MAPVLKKVWSLFTPAERRKAMLMLVLCVSMAMAETAGVISILPFLSVLARPEAIQDNPLLRAIHQALAFSDPRHFILALGAASVVMVVASSAFKTVTNHVLNRFVHLERHSIGTRLLSRYLGQPYEFFLAHNPSLLAKRVLAEVDCVIFDLLQPLAQLLAQGSVVLAMGILIFCYDVTIALCIAGALIALYGAIYRLVRQRLARMGKEGQMANVSRYQTCIEVLGGIKDVKISHADASYLQKFHDASRLFSRHAATSDTLSQSPLYIVEATGYTGLIFIALALLLRSNDVAHVLPALGLYGFAAYRMLPAAQIMYRGFARLRASSSTLATVAHDLALPVPFLDQSTQSSRETLAPLREIRLSGLRYAYPSTPDIPIFDDFDLVIPVNGSVGITGKSGAGKSTLMDLMLGLLQPQGGSLSVDGVPITTANVAAWQRAIGYVPQHIFLADASVAENIAFGVPPALIDPQAIERAARQAQIHDFVLRELPNGYDTLVGDRGIRLSGGQRQRVGIARALYRDPPVLFMDEATSALDTQTEEAVNETIRSLSGNKTLIVIAHRLSSLKDCQQRITLNSRPGAAPSSVPPGVS